MDCSSLCWKMPFASNWDGRRWWLRWSGKEISLVKLKEKLYSLNRLDKRVLDLAEWVRKNKVLQFEGQYTDFGISIRQINHHNLSKPLRYSTRLHRQRWQRLSLPCRLRHFISNSINTSKNIKNPLGWHRPQSLRSCRRRLPLYLYHWEEHRRWILGLLSKGTS